MVLLLSSEPYYAGGTGVHRQSRGLLLREVFLQTLVHHVHRIHQFDLPHSQALLFLYLALLRPRHGHAQNFRPGQRVTSHAYVQRHLSLWDPVLMMLPSVTGLCILMQEHVSARTKHALQLPLALAQHRASVLRVLRSDLRHTLQLFRDERLHLLWSRRRRCPLRPQPKLRSCLPSSHPALLPPRPRQTQADSPDGCSPDCLHLHGSFLNHLHLSLHQHCRCGLLQMPFEFRASTLSQCLQLQTRHRARPRCLWLSGNWSHTCFQVQFPCCVPP